jgi:hypothetical protein
MILITASGQSIEDANRCSLQSTLDGCLYLGAGNPEALSACLRTTLKKAISIFWM